MFPFTEWSTLVKKWKIWKKRQACQEPKHEVTKFSQFYQFLFLPFFFLFFSVISLRPKICYSQSLAGVYVLRITQVKERIRISKKMVILWELIAPNAYTAKSRLISLYLSCSCKFEKTTLHFVVPCDLNMYPLMKNPWGLRY